MGGSSALRVPFGRVPFARHSDAYSHSQRHSAAHELNNKASQATPRNHRSTLTAQATAQPNSRHLLPKMPAAVSIAQSLERTQEAELRARHGEKVRPRDVMLAKVSRDVLEALVARCSGRQLPSASVSAQPSAPWTCHEPPASQAGIRQSSARA